MFWRIVLKSARIAVNLLGAGQWSTPEIDLIKLKLGNLISTKPVTYLVNISEKDFISKKVCRLCQCRVHRENNYTSPIPK